MHNNWQSLFSKQESIDGIPHGLSGPQWILCEFELWFLYKGIRILRHLWSYLKTMLFDLYNICPVLYICLTCIQFEFDNSPLLDVSNVLKLACLETAILLSLSYSCVINLYKFYSKCVIGRKIRFSYMLGEQTRLILSVTSHSTVEAEISECP